MRTHRLKVSALGYNRVRRVLNLIQINIRLVMHWLDFIFDCPGQVCSDWGLQTWSEWQSVYLKGQCSNFYIKSFSRIQRHVSEKVRVEEKLYQRPLWVLPEPCEIWSTALSVGALGNMTLKWKNLWVCCEMHCIGASALRAPLATCERRSSMLEEVLCLHLHCEHYSLHCLKTILHTDYGAYVFASVEAAISVQEVGLFWYKCSRHLRARERIPLTGPSRENVNE